MAFTEISGDEFCDAIISVVGASRSDEPLLTILQDAQCVGKLQCRGWIHTPAKRFDVMESYDQFVTDVLKVGPNDLISVDLVVKHPANRK